MRVAAMRWAGVSAALLAFNVAVASFGSTKNTRPSFRHRFHRVASVPEDSGREPKEPWGHRFWYPNLDESLWISNRTFLLRYRWRGRSGALGRVDLDRNTLSFVPLPAPHVWRLLQISEDDNASSPDGKWVMMGGYGNRMFGGDSVRSVPATGDYDDHTVYVSSLDGKAYRRFKTKYRMPILTWLPDSHHWAELTWTEIVVHDIDRPQQWRVVPVPHDHPANPDTVLDNGILPPGGFGSLRPLSLASSDVKGLVSYVTGDSPPPSKLLQTSPPPPFIKPDIIDRQENGPDGYFDPAGTHTRIEFPSRVLGLGLVASYSSGRRIRLLPHNKYKVRREQSGWRLWIVRHKGTQASLLAFLPGDKERLGGIGWTPDGKGVLAMCDRALWVADVNQAQAQIEATLDR
jgi:hypothetical protein